MAYTLGKETALFYIKQRKRITLSNYILSSMDNKHAVALYKSGAVAGNLSVNTWSGNMLEQLIIAQLRDYFTDLNLNELQFQGMLFSILRSFRRGSTVRSKEYSVTVDYAEDAKSIFVTYKNGDKCFDVLYDSYTDTWLLDTKHATLSVDDILPIFDDLYDFEYKSMYAAFVRVLPVHLHDLITKDSLFCEKMGESSVKITHMNDEVVWSLADTTSVLLNLIMYPKLCNILFNGVRPFKLSMNQQSALDSLIHTNQVNREVEVSVTGDIVELICRNGEVLYKILVDTNINCAFSYNATQKIVDDMFNGSSAIKSVDELLLEYIHTKVNLLTHDSALLEVKRICSLAADSDFENRLTDILRDIVR
ncbi:MAG: hypothetical protein NC548_11220 [Lachnospiraceae bacterium]|nr:hypothetical protein [Lachnospiraceae bacterium]